MGARVSARLARVLDRRGARRLRRGLAAAHGVVLQLPLSLHILRTRGTWVPLLRSRLAADARAKEELARDLFFQEYTPQSGDVVVDVGAGAGEEVGLLSRLVGAEGRVIAIEAHPVTCEALRRRCEQEALHNVVAVNAAVLDAAGLVEVSDEDSYLRNRLTGAGGGHAVPAVTLDALLAEHRVDRVDFLKMNIEGAELAALRGLARSAVRVGCVAVSCHDFLADRGGDESNRTYADVRRLLQDYGFTVSERRRSDRRPWTRPYLYGTRRAEVPTA